MSFRWEKLLSVAEALSSADVGADREAACGRPSAARTTLRSEARAFMRENAGFIRGRARRNTEKSRYSSRRSMAKPAEKSPKFSADCGPIAISPTTMTRAKTPKVFRLNPLHTRARC